MKHIVIDPFDVASIDSARLELLKYKKWILERVHKLCQVLAEDYALRTVAEEFGYTEGGNVVCTVEEMPNGYRIVAAGEPVFFLEYGTGPAAGTGPILGSAPVSTEPGSYSATHAQTYQMWEDAGGESVMGPYKWTLQPRAGMYFAYRTASKSVQRVAKEVFSE